jgi:3-oxoacyl-[acyl-carrier-protein] synthase-3
MPLEAIRWALPSRHETAIDIARQTGGDEAFIRDKVGVAERYLLGPGETGVGLAAAAARKLCDEAGLAPGTIDLVVFVTQNPDRKLPQNSAMLCAELALPAAVASFDLALGCSGYVYGLSLCEALLAQWHARNALLVTCDPYSRIMAAEDLATNAVFGDAATASWISRDGSGARLGRCDFGTDGGGGEALRIDRGGAVAPLVALGQAGVACGARDDHRLRMDGRAVFDFVLRRMPASIARCLEANDLAPEEVDAYALHQGSAFMLRALARQARIPDEKLLMNIARYGNTVSSTVPMLLAERGPRIGSRGDVTLVSGFGVGLSWATGVLISEGPMK